MVNKAPSKSSKLLKSPSKISPKLLENGCPSLNSILFASFNMSIKDSFASYNSWYLSMALSKSPVSSKLKGFTYVSLNVSTNFCFTLSMASSAC